MSVEFFLEGVVWLVIFEKNKNAGQIDNVRHVSAALADAVSETVVPNVKAITDNTKAHPIHTCMSLLTEEGNRFHTASSNLGIHDSDFTTYV